MFPHVSLLCFAASYVVVFLLELFRLSPKIRLRMMWIWLWTIAGLIAHTGYLYQLAQEGIANRGVALSSWYHWCLIAAWALALIYLLTSMSRPKSAVGLFFTPLILVVIGIAKAMPSTQLFGPRHAASVWGAVHGVSLLIGTVSVMAGFAAGLMYLIKERRLKQKTVHNAGFRLPSLEWLRSANERSLLWSAFFLGSGILSGVILKLTQANSVQWSDPGVRMSIVLLVWLIVMTAFTLMYKPATMGRKVAYLTVASFIMLSLTLSLVIFGPSDHIPTAPPPLATLPFASSTSEFWEGRSLSDGEGYRTALSKRLPKKLSQNPPRRLGSDPPASGRLAVTLPPAFRVVVPIRIQHITRPPLHGGVT